MQIWLSDEAVMGPGPLMERLCFVERISKPKTDLGLSVLERMSEPKVDVVKKSRIRAAPHSLVLNRLIWPYLL
jgi:hypothetical protein